MQQIIDRKNLEHKHLVSLKVQDNYKASGMFKSKHLAYCFYFIPKYNLHNDFYGGDLSNFTPMDLEDLLMSQVNRGLTEDSRPCPPQANRLRLARFDARVHRV